MFITEESLDKGFWLIIQQGIVNKNILKQYFPNIDLIEQGNIIGINTEGSAIIDDFIKAYFSLAPWDDWYDPEYLDKLLISPDKNLKISSIRTNDLFQLKAYPESKMLRTL